MTLEERAAVVELLLAVDTLRYHYQSEVRPVRYASDVVAAQRAVLALLGPPPPPADCDCTCCRSGEHADGKPACGAVRLHWRCYLAKGHDGHHRAVDAYGTISDGWYTDPPADCDCTSCAIRMVGSLED